MPTLTLAEACCSFVKALTDDIDAGTQLVGDVAIPFGTRLISSNDLVIVEAFQNSSLQCYITSSNHIHGESSTRGVSNMKTLLHARSFETLYLGAKALKHVLCETRNKAKPDSTCAYAMAIIGQTGLKDIAHGFWTHPGAAEAVQQARALSYRGSHTISDSPCGEMTASTILLRR